MKNIGSIYLLIVATLFVGGCKDPIEEAVKGNLVDGESARFRDVVQCSDDLTMHNGLVNSKNRMGGYAGDELFFYDGVTAYFSSDREFSEMARRCFGPRDIEKSATDDGATPRPS